MTRKAGGQEWAALHDFKFTLDKFGLMELTRRRERDPMDTRKTKPITRLTIQLSNHVIEPHLPNL